MKRLSLFCYLFLSLCTSKAVAQSTPCDSLQSLHWMLGKWQSISEQQTIKESWQRVSNNTFEGVGKTTTTNSEFVETLRLVAMSQQVFYLAKIASNPLPVAFKAEVCNGELAKFVNLQHDFPTSLQYRLKSKQRLLVEVRGVDGKGFDIQFVKVD